MPSPQPKDLSIVHCSMLYSLPAAQRQADVLYVLNQGADLVSFTESSELETRQIISNACRNNGYWPIIFTAGDTQFAVKQGGSASPRVKSQNGVMVSQAVPGSFGPRYIRWVRVEWYGQDIWFHNAHWVQPHDTALSMHGELPSLHTKMTQTMAAQVKLHGQGDSICFFAGDINIDEGADNAADHPNMPNYIFRSNGLLTIWDEFHVVPQPTISHSVFDIIGSYRPDQQVRGKSYRVLPKQNSYHRPITATYTVDVARRVTTGGGGHDTDIGPNGGGNQNPFGVSETENTAVDPDFYATGGNIDWSDYFDDSLYPLPVASDDSQYGGE